MGGVTLDFVSVLAGVPRRASFCCCLKGSVTFSGSFPSETERVSAGLVSSTTRYNLAWLCFERTERKEGSLTSRGQLTVAG